jgi:diguanylate cyclase (GGDEF)-like protein
VVAPLLLIGMLLLCGVSALVTLGARSAAIARLDDRAASYRDLAEAQLRHAKRLGPVAAAAREQGVRMSLARADRPLRGGTATRTSDGLRTYTYTVAARRGSRRVRIALPDASIAEATRRTLALTLGGGAALLLLMVAATARRVRREAAEPLERLGAALDRVAAGESAHIDKVGGSREVRAVAERLEPVVATMAELTAQATTDGLTGVANRRSFFASLETELKRAQRQSTTLTLVLIDLDGFKEINDTHGHPFGDGVLQVIAEKVRVSLRATDVIGRVGGDEFAILLPDTRREKAGLLVQRAREQAATSIGGVELTWSAGVAAFPDDAREATTLVECADAALYCAKSAGAATTCEYDPEQAQAPHASGELAAIEAVLAEPDGIVPVFQPLVSLATGRISGYEALARFPHPPPRRPDEWFAAAARVGLGPELEARAVEAALAVGGRPPGTYLSFNLSSSALMSDLVLAVLPEDMSDLVIEITEHERVGDDERLAERLAPLRRRGARIAVDDAGAGYSGLQQVMRIQPDIIKLDRSLVANVDTDPAKAALIDSFVRFARRTGATVCAEGIETAEELKVVADLDVTYGQGFGLARPAAPWAPVATWVSGTLRTRTMRTDAEAAGDAQENSDQRLAALTSRLANVRSLGKLRELAGTIARELGADEVALLRRGAAPNTLERVSDNPWLPDGTVLVLSNYPTLRQVVSAQQVAQVLVGDGTAELGELSLLRRSDHGSMLLAPVVAHGEVAGVLIALTAAERTWTRAETSRARIVGHQLGALLDAVGLAPRAPLNGLPGTAAGSSRQLAEQP